jgi:hypothetical protein
MSYPSKITPYVLTNYSYHSDEDLESYISTDRHLIDVIAEDLATLLLKPIGQRDTHSIKNLCARELELVNHIDFINRILEARHK